MAGVPVSKKAFWDVSFDKLDFEKSSLFVMQKVFNYGSWDDQVAIMKFFCLGGCPQKNKTLSLMQIQTIAV